MQENLESVLIGPGKPWREDANERFNEKFRDEVLSMEWFLQPIEA
ncbi:integrase core domain-containing protein [Limnobacter litoralis]